MRPTSDTIMQRPDLGQAVYETMQAAPTMGYVSMQILPAFRVPVSAAEYPVIPKEALFNILDTRRGPYGHYNRYTGAFESGFYRTVEQGLERPIDDRFRALYQSKFSYELTISNILMQDILRAQEVRVKNLVFSTSNFTPVNAATAWATVATATPAADVQKGKDALRLNGIIPNTLVVPYAQYLNLITNKEVLDRLAAIFPETRLTGQVGIDHLKTYFDVERLLVAGSLYNTKNPGQNAVLSDIWGDQFALLCRTASPGADITEPCIGRTFLWNEGAGEEVIVEEYYSNETRSTVLRVRHDVIEAFLASFDESGNPKSEISKACGYLIDCKKEQ